MPVESGPIHAARDRIAVEKIVAEFFGKMTRRIMGNAGNRTRAMNVKSYRRREPEAVMFFSAAFIVAAAQQKVHRLGMRIGSVEISARIERQAKRVRLADDPLLK